MEVPVKWKIDPEIHIGYLGIRVNFQWSASLNFECCRCLKGVKWWHWEEKDFKILTEDESVPFALPIKANGSSFIIPGKMLGPFK